MIELEVEQDTEKDISVGKTIFVVLVFFGITALAYLVYFSNREIFTGLINNAWMTLLVLMSLLSLSFLIGLIRVITAPSVSVSRIKVRRFRVVSPLPADANSQYPYVKLKDEANASKPKKKGSKNSLFKKPAWVNASGSKYNPYA